MLLSHSEFGVTSKTLILTYIVCQPESQEKAEGKNTSLHLFTWRPQLKSLNESCNIHRDFFPENKKSGERNQRKRQRRSDQTCIRQTSLVRSPRNQ